MSSEKKENEKPGIPNPFNSNKNNLFPKPPKNNGSQLWLIIGLGLLIVSILYLNPTSSTITISKTTFENMVLSKDVSSVTIVDKKVEVTLNQDGLRNDKWQKLLAKKGIAPTIKGPHCSFEIGNADAFENELKALEKDFPKEDIIDVKYDNDRESSDNSFYQIGIMLLLIGGFWYVMRKMSSGMGGGQLFNIGKSKANLVDVNSNVKTTFSDVAGLEEAKEEIKEIVEFLKNPSKFTNLGGKIPKGALLVGPPGTGKTLLAKAVAGEAGVPFFSLSGSDFVEMFVGVGAARVRDLFKQAKDKAPCIIFIDEIDAVGRSRGRGNMMGSNDERENTLNSLLVEMDGFGTDSGIIILAATNRPDVLDSALLRPGRFDRMISIDKPDVIGREAIFKVHLQKLKLDPTVDSKKLAAQTPGFAGAEIMNVCNEAALIAARRNKQAIDLEDFNSAIDRVIGGLEKKNKLISPEEKKIVAYHEAGHAVAGWFLEHTDPLVKVSIVPRGVAALGYAQYLPKEQFLYTFEQLEDEMCMTLGGRVAEDIFFGRVSTGALSDLERITKMAYSLVTVYGMNSKIGNISFYDSKQNDMGFTKPYSEATAQAIDEEVRNIVETAYKRTKELLILHKNEVEILAKELLAKEVIFQTDLEKLIGKRPFDKQTNYQEYTSGNLQKELDALAEANRKSEEALSAQPEVANNLEEKSSENESH